MLVFKGKRWRLNYLQIAWPEDPGKIRALIHTVPAATLFHVDETMSAEVGKYAARIKPLWTSLICLTDSEEDLWQKLEPKSCRYEVRKALALPHTIRINENLDAVYHLFQEFLSWKAYRGTIPEEEWRGYVKTADIHSIYHEERLVAAHVVIPDFPKRARLVLSATADRNDPLLKKVIGPLNRRLHWHEILYYKQKNFLHYDFGGIIPAHVSPADPITKFKMSFGGEMVCSNQILVARNPLFRVLLRTLDRVKQAVENRRKRKLPENPGDAIPKTESV